jgi:hypothetical protein
LKIELGNIAPNGLTLGRILEPLSPTCSVFLIPDEMELAAASADKEWSKLEGRYELDGEEQALLQRDYEG